ncbi:complement C1q-like protein 4 [Mytilus edulis]|uniref:complement C1q-like protein 4 n=1 Tax=Mytilus edulis TaxID=6550 RepID=UPI0039F0996F
MENTIHGQEVHIKRLTERLKHMETKVKKNEQKCDQSKCWNLYDLGLQMRHSVIQNTDSTLKDRHIVLQKEPVVRKRYDVNTGKRLLVQPTVMQSTKIGFYAYLGQNEDNPGKHHTIIFDVQKTNVGNGYNPFSGLFTAPQDGLYAFATSIAMIHHYASFELVKNADVQGSFFVDAGGENEWRSSSSIVVLALVKGDVVFVRTSSTYVPYGNIQSSKDGRSSFTGWLIE